MQQPSLGERLRKARIDRGFTKPIQAAKRYGCDRSTIIRLETYNARNWSLLKLLQIASIYRVSLFDIIADDHINKRANHTGAHLLLVDDETTQRLIYAQYIKSAFPGIAITTLSNAIEALDWLHINRATLIITDHQMPGMDGQELIRKLNDTRLNKHTPTIIMTNKTETAVIRDIARQQSALYFDKREPKHVFITLISDALQIV